MSHEELKERLPLQALGALERDDSAEVEAHLRSCESCRAELAELKQTAAMLAHLAAPVVPPAELRRRVLASVPAEPHPGPTVARRWRPAAVFGGLAAAAGLAGLLISQARLSARLEETRAELERLRRLSDFLVSTQVATVLLTGTETAPAARGKLAYDPATGRAILSCSSLPPAPAGEAYQLWFIAEGKPLPGGVFTPDAAGGCRLHEEIPREGRSARVFAVTLEPGGGVPAPTGAIFLASGAP